MVIIIYSIIALEIIVIICQVWKDYLYEKRKTSPLHIYRFQRRFLIVCAIFIRPNIHKNPDNRLERKKISLLPIDSVLGSQSMKR